MINSYYKLKIVGKSPKRYLNTLIKLHINLLNIEYINNDVYIKVSDKDYEKIKKIKTSYKFEIVKRYGIEKIKYMISYHLIFIICMLFSLLILNILCNITFSIEVVHNNKELRNLLIEELNNNGIKKYHPVVSYNKKEEIINKIIEKHKDKIEWLEITRVGVKYIVNVEERIIDDSKEDTTIQNIVAKKEGIILKIDATSGEVVKKINDYVKMGDIIISGNIMKKDEIKSQVRASGLVYAETWYKTKVIVPLKYKDESYTGKRKYVLKFSFNDKDFALFNNYKYYEDEDLVSLKNKLLPFKISISKRIEKKVKKYDFDYESAVDHALIISSNKIEDKLDLDEYIISKKVLKKTRKDSKIEVEVFFRVYENITSASKLKEMTAEDYKKQEEKFKE